MRQIICDCCETVITKDLHIFRYLVHLEKLLAGKIGYVDEDWEPSSGKEESKDVCIYCYNRIMIEAVKKFREMHARKEEIMKDKENRKKTKKTIQNELNTTQSDKTQVKIPAVGRIVSLEEDFNKDTKSDA